MPPWTEDTSSWTASPFVVFFVFFVVVKRVMQIRYLWLRKPLTASFGGESPFRCSSLLPSALQSSGKGFFTLRRWQQGAASHCGLCRCGGNISCCSRPHRRTSGFSSSSSPRRRRRLYCRQCCWEGVRGESRGRRRRVR
jgi:hypothetical protein